MFLRRDEDILAILKNLSETVTPEIRNFRIVACLADSKGNIISFGFPRRKTHPVAKELNGGNEDKTYIHAELDCIIRSHKKVDREERKNLALYIHRAKLKRIQAVPTEEYEWVNGLSKPCETCSRLISKIGYRKVIYSTEEGYKLL